MGNKKVYVNAKALAAKERLEQKKIAEKLLKFFFTKKVLLIY
jgi:hypothetical protein